MPPRCWGYWALKRAHTPHHSDPTFPRHQSPFCHPFRASLSAWARVVEGEVGQRTREAVRFCHRALGGEGRRPGQPHLASIPGRLVLSDHIGQEKGSGLGAAGMEMLRNPVCCQDNFHFCPATPRPGQRLQQGSKARTDSGEGWVSRKSRIFCPRRQVWEGGVLPLGALIKEFSPLLFALEQLRKGQRNACPHFADGKSKALGGCGFPNS